MCRNIRTLANFEPPASETEVRDAALQFVRKLSGMQKPSRANAPAFEHAVNEVTAAADRLLRNLQTSAPPRDRAAEKERARARTARRFGIQVIVAAAWLVAPTAPLAAQFPAGVQVGTRVRLWLPEAGRQAEGPARRQLLRGTVEELRADTLRLSIRGTTGAIAVPRGTVRRLELSRGVSRPASAFERAVGGAIGGAVTWALMNDPRRRGGPHYRTDWRAAGVGATWGGGFGALTGFVFPYERWRPVRLRR